MVIVVPPFAPGDKGQQQAVPALVIGGVPACTKGMPDRVDRKGNVIENGRAAEQGDNNQLPTRCPKRRISRGNPLTEKIQRNAKGNRGDVVIPVE